MRARIAQADGRRLFGPAAETYERARPGHAPEVYEILVGRCGLRPGAKVLEIGPGTGQATRQLLDRGAAPLIALEPDPELAAFLQERLGGSIEIRPTTLEAAELENDFELAVAASAFHWVDERIGLGLIHEALRPGGSVALWWTLFGDLTRDDPFRDAVEPILLTTPLSPSRPRQDGPPFAADEPARVAALEAAGFEHVTAERLEWERTWDTEGTRDLFGTFSPILALSPDAQASVLDEIATIADAEFDGRVTRPLVTRMYAARKSS
jgi:SAM-dependent methyltransferase